MNVIIDYNAGNITSLANAIESLGGEYQISSDAEVIRKAKRVLFPGQGHIGQVMKKLEELKLVEVIRNLQQPFLGICVGMQLLFESSEEGDTQGLGILPGTVRRFSSELNLKVPHVGWNTVREKNEYFYFVHSYYCPINSFTIGTAEYGIPFSAIVQKENFFGTQFHPEKSGKAGLQFLQNFLTL